MSYRVTVVDDNDVVLDRFSIDGLALNTPTAQMHVGYLVSQALTPVQLHELAQREEPPEEWER